MKIQSIEATDMGNDQQEIADLVETYVKDIDFLSPSEFDDIEYQLIIRACKELGWSSVPTTGGLIVNWHSQDGSFNK